MRYSVLILCCSLLGVTSLNGQTVSEKYRKNWSDHEIQERIEKGIERNRKDWAELQFLNEEGEAVEWSGDIHIRQTTHDFLFGANIFMLNGYDEEWENEKYESIFQDLLNFATVPFYWKTLEPERGNVRFSAESEHIYRRPAPDIIVDFCNKHNITMKGHPLFWDIPTWAIPTWWPSEEDSMRYLIRRHVQEIAERYRNDILHWDVVNEANSRNMEVPAPHDYPTLVFKIAERHFGLDNWFHYNFTTAIWKMWDKYKAEYGLEYVLTENLMLKGCKVDAIGLQCHLWGYEQWDKVLNGEAMAPEHVLKILDLFGQFDLPLFITEITFPTLPEGEDGEKNQAIVTRNFYRLWFSHPNFAGITWWNVSDGTAAGGEDQWKGGFLRKNMSPKPSYEVLDELINHEWKTQILDQVDNHSSYQFKGFHGEYEIVLSKNGNEVLTKTVHLQDGRDNEFDMIISH